MDPSGEGAILGVSIHGHAHSRHIQQDNAAFIELLRSLVMLSCASGMYNVKITDFIKVAATRVTTCLETWNFREFNLTSAMEMSGINLVRRTVFC